MTKIPRRYLDVKCINKSINMVARTVSCYRGDGHLGKAKHRISSFSATIGNLLLTKTKILFNERGFNGKNTFFNRFKGLETKR